MTVAALSADQALRKAKSLVKKGAPEEAEQVLRAVLERFPGNRRVMNSLAGLNRPNVKPGTKGLTREEADAVLALYNSGRLAEAHKQTAALAAKYPQAAFLHNLLGAILLASERPHDAIPCFRSALDIKPDDARAYNNLGNALKAIGNTEDAVASIGKAVELKPDFADAHNNLGSALMAAGRSAEAIRSFETAMALQPDKPEVHNNLGNARQSLGQFDAAKEHYNRALAINPQFAEVHRNLGMLKKFTPGDPQIAQISRLLADNATKDSDRLHLNFALAKASDDIGDTGTAFDAFTRGNRIRKTQLNYSIAADKRLFARIKSIFANTEARLPLPNDNGGTVIPLFVVGMPRSGTSLVEQILASHPRVHGAGELVFMDQAILPVLRKAGDEVSQSGLQKIRSDYFAGLDGLGTDDAMIVDKMPLNFRWTGFILAAFPEACVINTMRDPVATGWSNFRRYFPSPDLGFTCDLADIAAYQTLYEDLMAFWRGHFPDRVYNLDYERLTQEQEAETRRLLDHCGLEWDERCLEFHKTSRAVQSASATQVRKKMYQGSSQEWERYSAFLQPLKDRERGRAE